MSDIVVFDKDGATYLKDHILLPVINKDITVIENPDLSFVRDIPSIFWKLEGRQIVEMKPVEKRYKLYQIKQNQLTASPIEPLAKLYPWWLKLAYGLVGDVVFFDKRGACLLKKHIVRPWRNPFICVVKSPDLSLVENIPARFWKYQGGRVVEMTPKEKKYQIEIEKTSLIKNPMNRLYPMWVKIIYGTILSLLIYKLRK